MAEAKTGHKRRGRPPKPPGEGKGERLGLTMPPFVKAWWEGEAKAHGLRPGPYLRERVLAKPGGPLVSDPGWAKGSVIAPSLTTAEYARVEAQREAAGYAELTQFLYLAVVLPPFLKAVGPDYAPPGTESVTPLEQEALQWVATHPDQPLTGAEFRAVGWKLTAKGLVEREQRKVLGGRDRYHYRLTEAGRKVQAAGPKLASTANIGRREAASSALLLTFT